jgi:hypothetical protein
MPMTSDLIYIQDFTVTQKLGAKGKELSEEVRSKRFLKPKGRRSKAKDLLFEENVHVRTIDTRSVEVSERIEDGTRTETTKCHGFDEKDLDKFEDEWSELWKPQVSQEEIAATVAKALP